MDAIFSISEKLIDAGHPAERESCSRLLQFHCGKVRERTRRSFLENVASFGSEMEGAYLRAALKWSLEEERSYACRRGVSLVDGYETLEGEYVTLDRSAFNELMRRFLRTSIELSEPSSIEYRAIELKRSRRELWFRVEAKLEKFRGRSWFSRLFGRVEDGDQIESGLRLAQLSRVAECSGAVSRFRMTWLGGAVLELDFQVKRAGTLKEELFRDEGIDGRASRILLVEDNVACQEILGTLLRRWDFYVKIVGSAEEALEVLSVDPSYRFGIFDIILSKASGEDLAVICRKRGELKGMRLISVSGSGSMPSEDLFDWRLLKPLTPQALKRALGGLAVEKAER
ncbi:MAG: hypothetical protein AAGB46_18335 [Verrucomicrobiota bacterium]